MPKTLNPNFLKIGYIILIATRKFAIEKLQRKAGYGDSSKWTHVAGSLGDYDAAEANVTRLRLVICRKMQEEQYSDIIKKVWYYDQGNFLV